MRKRTALLTLWATTTVVAFGVFGAASPSGATEPKRGPACDSIQFWNTDGIQNFKKADDTQPHSNGTAAVGLNGVDVSTPDVDSKVYFYRGASVLLVDVLEFSYGAQRLFPSDGVVLPSGQIAISPGGDVGDVTFTTLVYEPYQQGIVPSTGYRVWDATNGGAGKWWSSKPLARFADGATQAHPKTFTEFKEKYPKAALVYYGLNQGSGNAGVTSRWNDLTFKTTHACVKFQWCNRYSPRPSHSTSHTPSGSPSVSKSTTGSPTSTTSPMQSNSPSGNSVVTIGGSTPGALALTGSSSILWLASGGVVLIVGGLLILLALRRNRDEKSTLNAGD